MTDTSPPTRRATMIAALAAAGGARAAANTSAQPATTARDPALAARAHDWDWLVGRWNVRHHRLKARLAASTEWEDFDGTSTMLTLDGLGTVDDNWLDLPSGAYRAVGVRPYNAASGQWLIWWLDGRMPTSLDPRERGAPSPTASVNSSPTTR